MKARSKSRERILLVFMYTVVITIFLVLRRNGVEINIFTDIGIGLFSALITIAIDAYLG